MQVQQCGIESVLIEIEGIPLKSIFTCQGLLCWVGWKGPWARYISSPGQ